MNPYTAKKLIVCDLDGTLSESKSSLSPSMAETLCKLLSKHYLAVVSGAAFSQFQKQFLLHLPASSEQLKNLFIFPANGSTCFVYATDTSSWVQKYDESLTKEEKSRIISAIEESMKESGFDFNRVYGKIIEDRGGQITFSGLGQEAPLDSKSAWDPDQKKRIHIVDILKEKIPDFEIRIGGATSIDVTKKGIDKAYAMGKIEEFLNIPPEDIVFVGDALYPGGNDSSVKKTPVDYIQESGPDETEEFLTQYIG